MKSFVFVLFSTAVVSHSLSAQSLDTLLFTDQKVVCTVKEITPETVAYTLPGRDVLFKLDKLHLIKIGYGDGKVTESALVNKAVITNIEDWKNVNFSTSKEDIHGLFEVGQVAMLGSANNDWGKDCLKLEAALMGGNVVHVDESFQFTSTRYSSYPLYSRGGRNTAYYSYPHTSLYTQTSATVYTSKLPDTVAFKNMFSQKPILSWVGHFKHRGRKRNRVVPQEFSTSDSKISKYLIENHNIYVWLDLPEFRTTKFHLNYFDKYRIFLSHKNSRNGRAEMFLFLIKSTTLLSSKQE